MSTKKLFNEFLIAHLRILKEKSDELLTASPRTVWLLVFYPLIDLSTQYTPNYGPIDMKIFINLYSLLSVFLLLLLFSFFTKFYRQNELFEDLDEQVQPYQGIFSR